MNAFKKENLLEGFKSIFPDFQSEAELVRKKNQETDCGNYIQVTLNRQELGWENELNYDDTSHYFYKNVEIQKNF